MAFDMAKLYKFAPFVAVYAFYNVFATTYPSDPLSGMRTAFAAFMADPITKLKSKVQNLTTLAVVIIGVPIALKALKLPASLKMIVNIIVYYVIGDQLAAVINGPGRFGAYGSGSGRPLETWGGESSAFHQSAPSAGTIRNIYGG